METTFEILEIQAPGGPMPTWVGRPVRTLAPRVRGGAPTAEGGAPGAAVLVLMEAFGLNDHVRDVVCRLAEAGYVALAPDLYYRESEDARSIPYAEPDRAADMVMRTVALSDAPEERVKDDRMLADVAAALVALRADAGVDAERVALLGLSMGGRLAFLAACRDPARVRAVVVFYGGRIVPIVEESRGLRVPTLLLFAEKDPGISMQQVDRIRAELEHHGAPHEIETYAGVGHGFLSEGRDSYDESSAQRAWQRALGWLARHLG